MCRDASRALSESSLLIQSRMGTSLNNSDPRIIRSPKGTAIAMDFEASNRRLKE